MKKVILTGASGFIGRHAIPFLLQRGYQVHAVFHNQKSISNNNDNLIWHHCDLLNTNEQKKLFETVKATHLLHFAWNVDHKTYLSSPENQSWAAASLDMIKNFRENNGSRVVLAGTCFEYDQERKIYSEQTNYLRASSLYGECKIRLHEMVKDYARNEELSYAWGRIFFLYGPYEPPTRLVPSIILSLLRNQTARCLRGNLIRDFLYVADVASAFVAILEGGISGPVNIASCEPMALKDIVNTIADKLNKKELVKIEECSCPPNEPQFLAAELTRLKSEIGWKPNYNLEQGLECTIDWWQNRIRAKELK